MGRLSLGKHVVSAEGAENQATLLHTVPLSNLFIFICSVLSCYLSWAWSWGRRWALSVGRRLCAVDHDSMRVWLCTSLQNKLYLFPPPVSRLLEWAPNSPAEALQEGCPGRGGDRQLQDRGQKTWLLLFSYTDTTSMKHFCNKNNFSKSCIWKYCFHLMCLQHNAD